MKGIGCFLHKTSLSPEMRSYPQPLTHSVFSGIGKAEAPVLSERVLVSWLQESPGDHT